jgi:hypothetical protein
VIYGAQTIKPKARPIILDGRYAAWRVYGNGIYRQDFSCERAYQMWIEEYIRRALYGSMEASPGSSH